MNKLRTLWARLTRHHATIELMRGDITKQHVDAVVNAAKPSLYGGGGVDGAIHAAGGPIILAECRRLRATVVPDGLPTGQAVITSAGNMPARWVIHTVGPVYNTRDDQSMLLRSCYTSSLAAADRMGARTVAFPLISSGVYGWPVDNAIIQALAALRATPTAVKTVQLVFFDDKTYRIAQQINALI